VTRSDQAGAFRLSPLLPATYRVTARRVGYAPRTVEMRLSADTLITITLVSTAPTLDTVRVVARGTGVFGVVGESKSLRPIRGARVAVVGADAVATSDSSGKFVIPISKPGQYVVRATRSGYADQILSITVPHDAYVEVAALLDSASGAEHTGREGLWADFDKRLGWRAMNSAFVDAADLARYSGGNLTDALRASHGVVQRGMTIGAATCVFVNGEPKPGWPLNAFPVEQILAVELYGVRGDPTQTLAKAWPPVAGSTACVSAEGRLGGSRRPNEAVFAVIWLKTP
jgi:hypothetical protein